MFEPAFRRALTYVIPYWRRLFLVAFLSLVSTCVSLYLPLLARDLVDEALIGRDSNALVRVVVVLVAFTLIGFVLNVVSGLRYTQVSAEILFDMRLALYRHLQKLSPRFYARTRLGDVVSRLNNDIGEIQRVAAEAALAWVGNVLFLTGAVVVMAWLDFRLFLVGIALIPISLWTLVHYRRRLESRVATLRDRSADIGSFLIETLQAMMVVVTSNAQARETERFQGKNNRFIDALMAMQRVTYLSGGLPGLILTGSTALVFVYGGQRVIAETLTMGDLVAFMAYQMRLLSPVQALMGLYTNLATAKVSLNRVHEISDAEPEVKEVPGAFELTNVRGSVQFKGVSFSFDRRVPTLEDVSFDIQPGETVAIVGESGTGKSTIAHLLLRLFDPDDGSVSLDERDLRTVTLAGLRQSVAFVDQEPSLFHATVRENITYGCPTAPMSSVEAAAAAAGIHDFISSLPQGYDTVIGERGAALSVGERQRLAIARALLVEPAVLVLDEPTASLDPATERHVLDGYASIMGERTTIVISHRLELARRADRVLVLQNAHIVESGPATRLLVPGTEFSRLFGSSKVNLEAEESLGGRSLT